MSYSRTLASSDDDVVLTDSPSDDFARDDIAVQISTDGGAGLHPHHGIEDYIDIRPTADTPATSLTKFQIAMMIARFMIGSNTANMSPPVNLDQPFASAMDWGMINIGVELGTAAFKCVSRYWLDTWTILQNEGCGNAGLGLLTGTLRILVANLPSSLLGLGIGALLNYYREEIAAVPALAFLTSPPMARIIAALISPWIYVGTKKLIEHYFPQSDYQANTTPPLHPVQLLGILAFSIFDAVTIYEFVRVLIKAYGPEFILQNSHFGLGAVIIYVLLSNIVDPIAFGHSKLYGPPPFSAPVTQEEIGETSLPQQQLLDGIEQDIFLNNPDLQQHLHDQAEQEAMYANLKNGAVYAACAVLAIGAGLLADIGVSRAFGDTTKLSSSVRKLGVALDCTAAAVTQVLLNNNARWIIDKSSQCWDYVVHGERDADHHVTEVEPLLIPDPTPRDRRPPPPSYSPAPPPAAQESNMSWLKDKAKYCWATMFNGTDNAPAAAPALATAFGPNSNN